MMRYVKHAMFLVILSVVCGCGQPRENADAKPRAPESDAAFLLLESQKEEIKELYPSATMTESGLFYIVKDPGKGDSAPQKGAQVSAHYTGTLLNGEQFDSSKGGDPFVFPVGMGRVIKAWDEAFQTMKKGEKRTLIIPSHLGYGTRGAGGIIPPNAILVFDVELVDFD